MRVCVCVCFFAHTLLSICRSSCQPAAIAGSNGWNLIWLNPVCTQASQLHISIVRHGATWENLLEKSFISHWKMRKAIHGLAGITDAWVALGSTLQQGQHLQCQIIIRCRQQRLLLVPRKLQAISTHKPCQCQVGSKHLRDLPHWSGLHSILCHEPVSRLLGTHDHWVRLQNRLVMASTVYAQVGRRSNQNIADVLLAQTI